MYAKFCNSFALDPQSICKSLTRIPLFHYLVSLPNPAGKAGGACTSTLLKVLNEHNGPRLSWLDLLHKMRDVLRQKGFDQVPQLSASQMLNANDPFYICPPDSYGTKRAILIGINYVGRYTRSIELKL